MTLAEDPHQESAAQEVRPGGDVTSAKPDEDLDQEAIWQAQGILMELLGYEPCEADVWLRWRARLDSRSVLETAVQLVTRSTSW